VTFSFGAKCQYAGFVRYDAKRSFGRVAYPYGSPKIARGPSFREAVLPIRGGDLRSWRGMQKWEYRIFASHLDPAELVVIMNESGADGWELVAVVAVTDYQPLDLIEPEAAAAGSERAEEIVPLEAFRYIFKRAA
jgi:hypothetical protein